MNNSCFDSSFYSRLDYLNDEMEKANSYYSEIAEHEKQIEQLRKKQKEDEESVKATASQVFSEEALNKIYELSKNVGIEETFSVEDFKARFSKVNEIKIDDVDFLLQYVKRLSKAYAQQNALRDITKGKKPSAFLQWIANAIMEGSNNND